MGNNSVVLFTWNLKSELIYKLVLNERPVAFISAAIDYC